MTSRFPDGRRSAAEPGAALPRPRAGGGALSLFARILLRLTLAMALSLATLWVLIYSLGFLAAPSTLSVIRAESETVRYTVANPLQASFQIRGFKLFGDGDFDGACAQTAFGEDWAIEPQLGAEVTYGVIGAPEGDRRLLVEIRGFDDGRESAVLRGPGGVVSVKSDLWLRGDPECAPRTAVRLPVWGPGEIGGAPTFRADGPAPTLLSGSLEMYGRAAPLEMGLPTWAAAALGFGDPTLAGADDSSLYASLSSAFQIPPGSRVSTLPGQADPSLKALRGFAIQDGLHLTVAASTEAPEVFFFPPGAGANPDRLKMSLLSQIGNDPNIQRIIQIVIWFVVVLPIALELIKPVFVRRDEDG